MRIGIDGSNLRAGGGITHLVELLGHADPVSHGFSEITVWACRDTLDRITTRAPWLRKVHVEALDGQLLRRMWWWRAKLPKLAINTCDLLFAPGGLLVPVQMPTATMSRNMLPFEPTESARYGLSWLRFKMRLLRTLQTASFQRADGLIFLSNYARRKISPLLKSKPARIKTIPHGVNQWSLAAPREQLPAGFYSKDDPLQVLYVSAVSPYKHQWHVVSAVAALRSNGVPVSLKLVGGGDKASCRRLRRTINQLDPEGHFVTYVGELAADELQAEYHAADIFVYASSCENLPNIVLEAMTAGLPIASSDREPMPEILRDSATYFDPENHESICSALLALIDCPGLRTEHAKAANEYVKSYSWDTCARETFSLLSEVFSLSTRL